MLSYLKQFFIDVVNLFNTSNDKEYYDSDDYMV